MPDGEAPANATWGAMIRQRLLMPRPGALQVVDDDPHCCHTGQRGQQCPAKIDPDGVHEALCNLGGGPLMRHNQVRDWLAEKVKEAFGGRTQTEQPHPLANGRGNGRMDIKHDSSHGHLDIDVTVVSIHTSNVREAMRRQSDPNRALRAGIADKLATYGPGVLAFAVDDTGAISTPALRLLRRLALACGGEVLAPKLLMNWRAELQHVVLQATAGMAQSACGAPRTA